MPRPLLAELLINNVFSDWCDVFPRLQLPSLCIGGKLSLVPWESVEWQASQLPKGRAVIISAEDKGNHFAFMENPTLVNGAIKAFLAE